MVFVFRICVWRSGDDGLFVEFVDQFACYVRVAHEAYCFGSYVVFWCGVEVHVQIVYTLRIMAGIFGYLSFCLLGEPALRVGNKRDRRPRFYFKKQNE